MNRLVLIGNGFDLAHGLKTSYQDFINWYWDQRLNDIILEHEACSKDLLYNMTILPESGFNNWIDLSSYNSYFKNPYTNEYTSTGKDFFDWLLEQPDKFEITFSPLFEHIYKNIETKGWVDIEREYYDLLIRLHGHIENNYKNLNIQLDFLREKLIEYLKTEERKEINIIEDIKEKIYRPIKKKEISVGSMGELKYSLKEDEQPSAVMLLNFNYTNTPEKYVADNTIVNYIHGRLDAPDSVIFGYGDELDEGYKNLKKQKDNECLRHIKSIRYLEADNYRKVLEFIESCPFQVCIMGHSCGNSDRTLLNTLFEHRNCVSVKPYYYKKENGTDNYLEMAQNISRNFIDMKLMRNRVVNKKYCEPLVG